MNKIMNLLLAKALIDASIYGEMGEHYGYGGIDMCIKCKEKGADRYINGDGLEVSACESCPNNITAVKWNE